MGLEQVVTFPRGKVPPWPAVSALLARHGLPAQVRMIDGELAFPDEVPKESWRELRLGMTPGMVTARRETDRVLLVTWGNADQALLQAWNALTWAFAEAGDGQILGADGSRSASGYRSSADLPMTLQE